MEAEHTVMEIGLCNYKNVKTASLRDENWRFWSGLRDLNPWPLDPKRRHETFCGTK